MKYAVLATKVAAKKKSGSVADGLEPELVDQLKDDSADNDSDNARGVVVSRPVPGNLASDLAALRCANQCDDRAGERAPKDERRYQRRGCDGDDGAARESHWQGAGCKRRGRPVQQAQGPADGLAQREQCVSRRCQDDCGGY